MSIVPREQAGVASGNSPPDAPRRRTHGRLRLLALLGLAGALVGLAGPWLAERVWLGFDVFSHFRPHFAVLAVAALAGVIRPTRGILLTGMVLVLAVPPLLAAVSRYHAAVPPADAGEQRDTRVMRVMSFNSWMRNDDLAAIEAEIRRLRPDFVGIPEFFDNKLPLRQRLRDAYPHQADCVSKPFCHLGFFSRWPIESVRAASLWEGPPYLHAVVRTPGGRLHVVVLHTLRFPWMGSQMKQLRAIARIVRRLRRKGPVLVMGDFNATPYSYMLRAFQRSTGLKRLTWLPTWPARPLPWPQLAIDHVFVSGDRLQLLAGPFVGRSAGSDHLPVLVELRWR